MTIRTPTVLILGAGASSHCGYPLGLQLIANVVKSQREGTGIPVPSSWRKEDVDRFVARLSRAGHYSIDAFLETTPTDMDLGKYLIAHCLKQHENIDHLFPPYDSGWYQYLFNRLISDSDRPFAGNAVTIVTYNYDRSWEAYLYHALMARFGMKQDEAASELSRIPVIHVHGTLGKFPGVEYAPSSDVAVLQSISKSINIIHEIRERQDGFCSDKFRTANAAITAAAKVVFLGFGFHPDNVRRLRVDWRSSGQRKVLSTFHDITPQEHKTLIQRLSEFGFSGDVLPFTGNHTCNTVFRHVTSLE